MASLSDVHKIDEAAFAADVIGGSLASSGSKVSAGTSGGCMLMGQTEVHGEIGFCRSIFRMAQCLLPHHICNLEA